MKCDYCLEDWLVDSSTPIGIELPVSEKTIHKCSSGKSFRLVGLRSRLWFVIQEVKNNE